MKRRLCNTKNGLLLSFALGSINAVFSQQNVGISETPITPDVTSILEVYSTTKGILIPRLTTAQRMAIAGPANGLLVFDTNVDCFMFYSATTSTWKSLCNSSAAPTGYCCRPVSRSRRPRYTAQATTPATSTSRRRPL